jgi:UDP:flavonoid glycosyltransferase YjiC (YdhE family)
MAKIVLAAFGSLGDLHPVIALGLELRRRGHETTIAAMDYYREKIELTGLPFASMAPHMDVDDKERIKELMHESKGPENIIRGIIMPSLRPMYDDLLKATAGADMLISGEIVYAAKSVAEKTGIKWVSTTLAPISLFSAYDPPVPPQSQWFASLRLFGPPFHKLIFKLAKMQTSSWLGEYRKFRMELALDPDDDPIFDDKYSDLLHLVMFSRALGAPQPDWPPTAVQTGFCFYDGQQDSGTMPDGLEEFLSGGEPPIVFTLGSAAVMDAGSFFDESAKAAKELGRRAILIYGRDNEPPHGLDDRIVGFDYAPFSLVFSKAACVVHQGGVGTTGQVLRAGVPQLIMPYGHDQPDNALRCKRAGVGEVSGRYSYTAESAAAKVKQILSNASYPEKAARLSEVVRSEGGTATACDAIEKALSR